MDASEAIGVDGGAGARRFASSGALRCKARVPWCTRLVQAPNGKQQLEPMRDKIADPPDAFGKAHAV